MSIGPAWMTIAASSLLLATQECPGPAREERSMSPAPQAARTEPLLVRSLDDLIRFRLVPGERGAQLVVAAKSRPAPGETATDAQALGVRWLVFALDPAGPGATLRSNVWVEGQPIKSFDLCGNGASYLWVVEANGLQGALLLNEAPGPGSLVRVPPFKDGPTFPADLPGPRVDQVEVKIPWHSQLSPESWLFNPRVRKDPRGKAHIVCNSTDGHLLELRGPRKVPSEVPDLYFGDDQVENWDEIRFLAGRLHPVVKYRVTASLKANPPINLFWSLVRYSGPPAEGDPRGDLRIEVDGGTATNLSADLGLGPVRAFDMDAADEDRLAIAALHSEDGQTLLTVLRSSDGGEHWGKLESRPLEGQAGQVSLLSVGGRTLIVVYSLVEHDFSILKMITLPWND
jgi:hypothetical protein